MAVTESLTPSEAPTAEAPASVRRRLSSPLPSDRLWSWVWTGLVALLALVLRLIGLAHPNEKIFDEVYYAKEAHDLLGYGVERNNDNNGPGYVVHPPLGKWLIAVGEHFYGYNSFGWRISAAVIGALSILLLARIARRMFGSTLLGCVAGLLLALDGLHFVMSRVALLDIFLMFFLLLAFGCAVLDRDHTRALLLRRVAAGEDLSAGLGWNWGWANVPWWRLATAVSAGLALGVKWSASWYVIALGVLVFWWSVTARRSVGVRRPVWDAIGRDAGWFVLCGVLLLGVYIACWTGWFMSDDGWNRHGDPWPGPWWLPSALGNLWEYHVHAYQFHVGLDTPHDYQSTPWSWLILGRPVAYYYSSDPGCGASNCSAEVLALGTPLLWWSFIPAIIAMIWRWLARRDWRAGALLLAIAAGIVPWTFYPTRTMFYFYTLPALPFMVLAVTMVLGMVLGPGVDARLGLRGGSLDPAGVSGPDRDRRLVGAVAVACYLLLVGVTFAYFYPIYTGERMTYDSWHARMWFDSWI